MRVFISWSREPSRTIAVALASWLGGLVQAAEPWVSDEEIGSGKRWRDEVAKVLDEADFGIICLTRANQHNPWLMFESGALAKHLSQARVTPLYIDLDAAEVTGPLADWQGRSLDRDGMWRVVHDINAATAKPVAKDALQRLFDRMWPDLEGEVAAAKNKAAEPEPPKRSAEDMLEEIVDRVRRLERPRRAPRIEAIAAVMRKLDQNTLVHRDFNPENLIFDFNDRNFLDVDLGERSPEPGTPKETPDEEPGRPNGDHSPS